MRQQLLKAWSEGMAMPESLSHITTESQWRSLVLKAGGKYWHVYMSKKTAGGRNTARYLGRYLKKPPIAASRLAHYNGGASLSFRYLDPKTGETATETLTQRELVARLKQHIPEKFFKMVRYFGFLANRVCGEKLPQVYRALGMDKPEPVAKVWSLYIDLCNCLILICSIQHQMKVNLWTKNSYRLWLTNWPKTSNP
ncbi:Putative transposase [Klebsiella pneumoniae]|uniref:Transposase n=1 Tax=Klebsiella pneumoniae TaxID=573 RepID=A0A378H4L5_KLEPN|nr:Putative transposase [Klebsiella pneumoniae]